MLNKILNMFRRTVGVEKVGSMPTVFNNISAETEVSLIKLFLERKFKRKFQERIKVDGFLGSDLEYRLVIDDHNSGDWPCNYHSIWGKSVKNVLDVRKAFVEAYWHKGELGKNAPSDINLDKWDSDRAAEYRETTVASSREELFLRASVEGLI